MKKVDELINSMESLLKIQGRHVPEPPKVPRLVEALLIKKPTKGTSFTTEKSVLVPAGKYTVIEPDDRNNKRMIISNDNTQELYAVLKKFTK